MRWRYDSSGTERLDSRADCEYLRTPEHVRFP